MADVNQVNNAHQHCHEERMKDPAYRKGYEAASRELEGGTESLDCGCVRAITTGNVIFGPVDCKEHGDE